MRRRKKNGLSPTKEIESSEGGASAATDIAVKLKRLRGVIARIRLAEGIDEGTDLDAKVTEQTLAIKTLVEQLPHGIVTNSKIVGLQALHASLIKLKSAEAKLEAAMLELAKGRPEDQKMLGELKPKLSFLLETEGIAADSNLSALYIACRSQRDAMMKDPARKASSECKSLKARTATLYTCSRLEAKIQALEDRLADNDAADSDGGLVVRSMGTLTAQLQALGEAWPAIDVKKSVDALQAVLAQLESPPPMMVTLVDRRLIVPYKEAIRIKMQLGTLTAGAAAATSIHTPTPALPETLPQPPAAAAAAAVDSTATNMDIGGAKARSSRATDKQAARNTRATGIESRDLPSSTSSGDTGDDVRRPSKRMAKDTVVGGVAKRANRMDR
jgi:hypothetical protein